MIDLQKKLSEYTYGFGATREAEQLLKDIGISTTPFLPSLRDEGKLGYDVEFDRPGVPLLLQFKLGQSLERFVRKDLTVPRPDIDRPFWRFNINTAERDGQFQILLKAEEGGAEVHYVAPRFSHWRKYTEYYMKGSILDNSLLISPVEIRNKLASIHAADGPHRVVYDKGRSYVCSRPVKVKETKARDLGHVMRSRIEERAQPINLLVKEIWNGLDRVVDVRRTDSKTSEAEKGRSQEVVRRQRSNRLEDIRRRAPSEDVALALALGVEFWGLGAQLIFATLNE